MNHNADINGVPMHHSHSHFFDYVEEFHGLQPIDIEKNGLSTQQKLRHQLIHDNNWEHKLCIRDCFKLSQKKYVEFCLDRKCGGVDFQKGATILGYSK